MQLSFRKVSSLEKKVFCVSPSSAFSNVDGFGAEHFLDKEELFRGYTASKSSFTKAQARISKVIDSGIAFFVLFAQED